MSETAPTRPRTVVLGVGNDLMRDDGVGTLAARLLREENLGPDVEVVEGGVGGLDLIFEMEGFERVILVDAARMGLEPGALRVVSRDDIEGRLEPLASLHQLGMHDVLELAELAGVTAEVTLVAVQPAEVLPGEGLTPAVQAALPEVVRTVKEILSR